MSVHLGPENDFICLFFFYSVFYSFLLSLLLNMEIGWSPASASNPLSSVSYNVGVTGEHAIALTFVCERLSPNLNPHIYIAIILTH